MGLTMPPSDGKEQHHKQKPATDAEQRYQLEPNAARHLELEFELKSEQLQQLKQESAYAEENVLQAAMAIQLKCAALGFDWPEVSPVFDKVLEEIDEVKAEVFVAKQQQAKIEDEIGDLLFSVVNLSRHLNVQPDIALQKATAKFSERFALVEQFAAQDNLELANMHIDALEVLWQKAKVALLDAES